MPHDFSLFKDRDFTHHPARWWLWTAVWALAVAGVFSTLLIFARTPAFKHAFPLQDFFFVTLVVHVNLSVLIWFLAIAAMLWSMAVYPRDNSRDWMKVLHTYSLGGFMLGTFLIAASAFTGQGEPLMSNYVPVLTNGWFFVGLILVGIGAAIAAFSYAATLAPTKTEDSQAVGLWVAAVITCMALVAFFNSFYTMPEVITGEQYYDLLFWAGGHLLQFTHMQMMLIIWLWLASSIGFLPVVKSKVIRVVYALTLITVALGLGGLIFYNVESYQHRLYFTHLMMGGHLIPSLVIGAAMVLTLWHYKRPAREHRAIWACLLMSVLVYFVGGMIGYQIKGSDVTIPAHYHGSIVGVTLAFMGLVYLMLPRFGYAAVAHTRMAFWQPWLYGIGQLMWITGMAGMGGYNIPRKTPGAISSQFEAAQVYLHIFRTGGGLALLGGLFFTIVVIRAWVQKRPQKL